MNKEEIIKIIQQSKTKSEVALKLGYQTNGTGMRKVTELVGKYNVDISHFGRKRKYELIEKECPVCETRFETRKGDKKEKQVCSHACSNTYFRSGDNNPNYKDINDYTDKYSRRFSTKYRKICFDNHEHKCVVCNENKILDVHHFDENKFNNEPNNLIPICATHHNYLHSKYRNEIIDKVVEYRENFINKTRSD